MFVIVLSLLTAPFVVADGVARFLSTKSILEGTVKVENEQSVWKSETIKTLEYRPTTSIYVVRGEVQFHDIEGKPYLEMWNIMPDGNRYFSRHEIVGSAKNEWDKNVWGRRIRTETSGWHEFELPFNLLHYQPQSVTLEINVVMPGKGMIEVSGLTISDVRMMRSDVSTPAAGEWFDGATAGIIGGIVGTACGIYGAALGSLAGFLIPRGRGRKFLLGMIVCTNIIGITSILIGISALLLGQPYHVWYGFVLLGGIFVFVFFPFFFVIPNAYRQAELRRMQALDM
jgi:hypothetical protein